MGLLSFFLLIEEIYLLIFILTLNQSIRYLKIIYLFDFITTFFTPIIIITFGFIYYYVFIKSEKFNSVFYSFLSSF